jgi:hypothetical protein
MKNKLLIFTIFLFAFTAEAQTNFTRYVLFTFGGNPSGPTNSSVFIPTNSVGKIVYMQVSGNGTISATFTNSVYTNTTVILCSTNVSKLPITSDLPVFEGPVTIGANRTVGALVDYSIFTVQILPNQ